MFWTQVTDGSNPNLQHSQASIKGEKKTPNPAIKLMITCVYISVGAFQQVRLYSHIQKLETHYSYAISSGLPAVLCVFAQFCTPVCGTLRACSPSMGSRQQQPQRMDWWAEPEKHKSDVSPAQWDVRPATPSWAVHVPQDSERRRLLLHYQLRQSELLWNKAVFQKHLIIHTTLPALLFPDTIKEGGVQTTSVHLGIRLMIPYYIFCLSHKYLSSTRMILLAQTAGRFVCQGNQCSFFLVSCPFKPSSLCSSMVKRWGTQTHQPQSPSTETPAQLCRCPCQNAGVLMVLCILTSLLSLVTFQTAGKLLAFNSGSSNTHSMATSFIVSEVGVPQSEGEGERRINDCLHELFSTVPFQKERHRAAETKKEYKYSLIYSQTIGSFLQQ